MNPETGVTILTILQKRVPFDPTAIVYFNGKVATVFGMSFVGRDLGEDFDRCVFESDRSGTGPAEFVYTNEIRQILDPTNGQVIFDATDK